MKEIGFGKRRNVKEKEGKGKMKEKRVMEKEKKNGREDMKVEMKKS